MAVASEQVVAGTSTELATLHVDPLLVGIEISRIHEINRPPTMTPVPRAPKCVRGVVNLRGNVVTVVDLRIVLGLPPAEITQKTVSVILNSEGEQIGILVDRVGDVVNITRDEIESPPANMAIIDSRFVRGVYQMEKELLVLLDVSSVLAASVEPN